MRILSNFLDWINENPYIIIIAIITVLSLRCSTPQSTIELEKKAEKTEKSIETGKTGCLTSDCKEAMARSKEYIKDSLDVIRNRDNEVNDLQSTIDDLSAKHKRELAKKDFEIQEKDKTIVDLLKELEPWRSIKKWFWIIVITSIVGTLLYIFRGVIGTALKVALKLG